MTDSRADDRTKDLRIPDLKEVEEKAEVLKRIRRSWLRQPGVIAIDIGYKVIERQERFLNDLAIRVHVKDKHTPNFTQRSLKEIVEAGHVPAAGLEVKVVEEGGKEQIKIQNIPLDIIHARYFPTQEIQVGRPKLNQALEEDELLRIARSPANPLVGGLSIGNKWGSTGTLGAVVWDRTDGTACILSNWHILAGSPSAVIGQPCFQPAIFDGGTPADSVATLKRWCFGRAGDAALAEIIPGRDYCSGEILGLHYPVTGILEPHLGMEVSKWGRTTKFSEGFIDGIHMACNIEYGGGVVQAFEDQVHIAPRFPGDEVSAAGDSGTVWVTKVRPLQDDLPNGRVAAENRWLEEPAYYAVALNFAGDVPGSQFGEYAVASRMTRLAELLEFSFRPLFVPRQSFIPQRADRRIPLQDGNPSVPSEAGGSLEPGDLATGTSPMGPQPWPERMGGGG